MKRAMKRKRGEPRELAPSRALILSLLRGFFAGLLLGGLLYGLLGDLLLRDLLSLLYHCSILRKVWELKKTLAPDNASGNAPGVVHLPSRSQSVVSILAFEGMLFPCLLSDRTVPEATHAVSAIHNSLRISDLASKSLEENPRAQVMRHRIRQM